MRIRELHQHEMTIREAILFGKTLDPGVPERAMVARFICVLVSGYLENIVRCHLTEYVARSRPKPELVDYVEWSIDRFQNAAFEKISEVSGRFKSSWRTVLEGMDDEVKLAVNPVVSNRHLIAHGRSSGISFDQVVAYFEKIEKFGKSYERLLR